MLIVERESFSYVTDPKRYVSYTLTTRFPSVFRFCPVVPYTHLTFLFSNLDRLLLYFKLIPEVGKLNGNSLKRIGLPYRDEDSYSKVKHLL